MRDNPARDEPGSPHRTRCLLPRARGSRRRAHARRLGAALRGRVAALRGVRRAPRAPARAGPALPPEARVPSARPEPPRVGRRPALQRRLPRAPHGAAAAGRGGRVAPARRPRLRAAARPLQAAVGDLARRPRRRGPLRAGVEDAPLPRRRHLRRRHRDRALRPRRGSARAGPGGGAVGAAPGADAGGAARRRAGRSRGDPAGTRPRRGGGGDPSAGGARGRRHGARRARLDDAGRPRRRAALAAQREDRAAPALRLGRRRAEDVQGDQGRARRHGQRRRAHGRRGRAPQPLRRARPRHRRRAEGDGAGLGARRGGARRARQQGRGDVRAAADRPRGPDRPLPRRPRGDARPEGLRPGGRRRDAHRAGGLRAADDPLPGGAAPDPAAILQPDGDERAGPAVPALPARPAARAPLPAGADSRERRARDRDHVLQRPDRLRSPRRLRRAPRRRRRRRRAGGGDRRAGGRGRRVERAARPAHALQAAGLTLAPLSLALAQVDPRVGDLEGNARLLRENIERARDAGAELVLFPELVLTGYPPEDLLLKEHFLQATQEALDSVVREVEGIVAVVGYPQRTEDVHNAIAVIADRAVVATYRKTRLWNYGVADEPRYFQAGEGAAVLDLGDARLGLTICEDIWVPGQPAADEALAGALLLINPSASPYEAGKGLARERMLIQRARDNLCAVAFCNLVGGQDELVFDGHSVVADHTGAVIARAPQFAEALTLCTVDLQGAATARLRETRLRPPVRSALPDVRRAGTIARHEREACALGGAVAQLLEPEAEVYAALCLGVRDYVHKNGFQHVVLGLSGGIDSTLVALIAADALGADRVTAAVMPSRYSSEGTQSDARALAASLGIDCLDLPIGPAMEVYERMLAGVFAGREPDITEENLQARIRGNLLMALSNKFGWLVLTTGNKSEMSVGYSTLYGDSAGGFAVIKDCPKLLVYRLVRERARRDERSPVPESIVTRAPSAELRPDQRDQDSLPPYEVLDAILEGYVEQDLGREQLIALGLREADVDRVIRLVDLSEYKRRQNPPGIKVTPRAFGRDRRMPITNAYRPRSRPVVY